MKTFSVSAGAAALLPWSAARQEASAAAVWPAANALAHPARPPAAQLPTGLRTAAHALSGSKWPMAIVRAQALPA